MSDVGSETPRVGGATAPASLAQLLLDHPFADAEPLLCTVEGELAAGEARRRALRVAEEIRAAGVRPDQAVAIQLPTGPDLVIAMMATWIAGAVFVPVGERQPPPEVERIRSTIRPAAYLGQEGLEVLPEPQTFDADVAFVTWTSGTTGLPKAILQTHTGYLEILDRVLGPLRSGGGAAAPAAAAKKPSPNLVPVSVALNAGIYNVLFGLRAGAAVVLMPRFATAEFATLVRRYQIRSTVLPPPAMVMLADDDEVTDLSPLKYVRSITAPLSPLAAKRFADKFGVYVLNGYGQAEIGEVIGWTAADAKNHPDRVGAVGKPHPGVDIRVVDGDGQDLAPGEVGDLLVRPPRMAAGYAGGESLADRVDGQGYVRTGDFARIDDAGFVWIEGRASDLINRGGNKVFPDHVEEVLRLHPAISEAAVVGAPDERLGEVPVAFVVGDASDEELRALCRQHLVPYKIPAEFHRVDSLPRSDVGKVLRRQLADRLR